jgi:hypothetical protein
MKRNLLFAVIVTLSLLVMIFGCDLIGKRTEKGSESDTDSGPTAAKSDSTELSTTGPAKILTCCTITNFKVGIITKGENGEIIVKEVNEIPYVPGTYIGVKFNYESKTGKPIEYFEEEFFPEAPLYWEEIATKNYKVFIEEKRAEYTSMLPPKTEDNSFVSYWILKPTGDPMGKWVWDIYFDREYFTTVVFNVVPAKK